MRASLVASLIALAAAASPAESFRLETAAPPPGEPYQPRAGVQIEWRATNDLPKALWVYKVTPQVFPSAVLSNLLVMCHLQASDAAEPPPGAPSDTNLLHFKDGKTSWNHFLLVSPAHGWIQYMDASFSHPEPTEDVPDDAKVERLALDCLFRLGIDRSQLADKPRSRYPAVGGKLGSDGKKLTAEVFQRGISFTRRIDGVLDAGKVFWIDFRSHGRIKRFDLVWRNLSPHEIYRLACPSEVIGFLRAGRAVAPMQDYDWAGSLQATNIAITGVWLYYFDEPGMKPLDYTYPYAELEMAADMGSTNTAKFYLLCPVLSK
jgi:hypothetical protein